MKKRIFAVLCAVLMLFTTCVCVSADEATEAESNVWEITTAGMDITLPEKWIESGRYFSYKPYEILPGAMMTNIVMYNATEEELSELNEEFGDSEEKWNEFLGPRVYDITMIASLDDEVFTPESFLEAVAEGEGVSVEELGVELNELGKADGWSFYSLSGNAAMFRHPEPIEGTEELVAMAEEAIPEFFENITFYEPIPEPKTEEGTKLSFKTVDFEGNEIDSAELFAKNKYTMVNIWMSWCTYCVEEMPELEEMNAELAKDGCGIIGVMLDGDVEEKLEIGKGIVEKCGVTFPMLVPNDEIKEQIIAVSYPTTIFVDSEGVVIGEPIKGMNVPAYKERMAALISGEDIAEAGAADAAEETGETAEAEAADAEAVDAEAASGYNVLVQDEDGNPLENAVVQFCSETECMMGFTGADGIAAFDVPGGTYTIHILGVPEGFKSTSEEFAVPEDPGTVVITLEK